MTAISQFGREGGSVFLDLLGVAKGGLNSRRRVNSTLSFIIFRSPVTACPRSGRFENSPALQSPCQNSGVSATKARNVIAHGNALGWVVHEILER
jgi:hypothetical protein